MFYLPLPKVLCARFDGHTVVGQLGMAYLVLATEPNEQLLAKLVSAAGLTHRITKIEHGKFATTGMILETYAEALYYTLSQFVLEEAGGLKHIEHNGHSLNPSAMVSEEMDTPHHNCSCARCQGTKQVIWQGDTGPR